MIAIYYAIREYTEVTAKIGDIVDEGIVNDIEQTIYPGQNTNLPDLPQECELSKFQAKGYVIETCKFVITRVDVSKRRISGANITLY